MTTTQPEPRPGLLRRTLRNRWLPILGFWFLGSALLAGLVYSRITPLYRASSLLRVEPVTADLYGVKGTFSLDTYLQTQVLLLTSPNVLNLAASDPRAVALPRIQQAKDAVLELKRVIQVGVIGGTSLIEVSMTSESPREAATLVSAVVDSFLASHNDWSEGSTRKQREQLENYLADLNRKSNEVENQWKQILAKGDPDAPVFLKGLDKRAEVTRKQYEQLEGQLFEVKLELAVAQARASALKAAASNAEKNPASPADEALLTQQVEQRFNQDVQTIDLAARIKDLKGKLAEIRKTDRAPEDPAERKLSEALAKLAESFDQLWAARSKQFRREILANQTPAAELSEAEAKVRLLGVRQQTLMKEFDALEIRNPRRAEDEVDLALIQDQRASLREMKEAVVRRLEQINFESKCDPGIRISNAATPPGAPISDPRMPMLALIPLVLLPVSFALFLGVEAIAGPRVAATAKPEPPAEV